MQIPTRNADSQSVQFPVGYWGSHANLLTNQGLDGKTESTHDNLHGFDADWGGRKSVSADCYRTIENNEQNLHGRA